MKIEPKVIKTVLKQFYTADGPERCGMILGTQVIELQNMAGNPEMGFLIGAEDNVKYSDEADATWHTHPGSTANLSGDDYEMFRMWPDMLHFIIGNDGVRCYYFDKDRKAVMEYQDA